MLAVAKLLTALTLALGVHAATHGLHARAGHHGAVVRRGDHFNALLARQAAPTEVKVNRSQCRPRPTSSAVSTTSTSVRCLANFGGKEPPFVRLWAD